MIWDFFDYDVKAAFDEFREIYEENKDGKIMLYVRRASIVRNRAGNSLFGQPG